MVAPLPLFWTEGAAPTALAIYEAAILFLWWFARRGNPVRLSDWLLNVIGLSYFVFLGFEILRLHHGLLRSVSHLLLFTAVAKLASLKRPGEARTALLVLFLLTLASASSSTHVASLLYFAAMALLGFRALCRLAVLADFDDAPPERVLGSVPTGGVALGALLVAGALSVPLFYALPRLHGPFAVARLRLGDALSTAVAADRVELESFASAKRSDRVILSMDVEPRRILARVLRLRQAVFTQYRLGVWTRGPLRREDLAHRVAASPPLAVPKARPAGGREAGRISIDLNLDASGFLFLPYASKGLSVEHGFPHEYPDGVVQLGGTGRSVRYQASVRLVDARGAGTSAIDPSDVPQQIRDYAQKLTGDTDDPREIYSRIRKNFVASFLYTLDPPHTEGDPVVHFLLYSKAGHCEYFASAAALMLTARGIPARLVTGSYGGEVGFFSRSFVVRGSNLHAWVEADLDGTGFSVLDPTPPAGLPSAERRVSWTERLSGLGREIEFFYDRRILGFDSLDQAAVFDAARQTIGTAASMAASWKKAWRQTSASEGGEALAVIGAAALLLFAIDRWRRRPRLSETTRAYLSLRRLAARRLGSLSVSVPPGEVARLLSTSLPQGREDASTVVAVYCAEAFGGIEPDRKTVGEIHERLERLNELVSRSGSLSNR